MAGTADRTREVDMLAKAQTEDGAHVPTLLDTFTLRGPNGTHVVLVTDIVVCMSSMLYLNRNCGPFCNKNAAHGLTQALISELTCNQNCSRRCSVSSFYKGYCSPTFRSEHWKF